MVREILRKVLEPDRRELIPLLGYPIFLRNVNKGAYSREQSNVPVLLSRAVYHAIIIGGLVSGTIYGFSNI